jgi:NAD-dependent DNA ligase
LDKRHEINMWILFISRIKQNDLTKIPGIGPIAARSIKEWFNDKENLAFINKLINAEFEVWGG